MKKNEKFLVFNLQEDEDGFSMFSGRSIFNRVIERKSRSNRNRPGKSRFATQGSGNNDSRKN